MIWYFTCLLCASKFNYCSSACFENFWMGGPWPLLLFLCLRTSSCVPHSCWKTWHMCLLHACSCTCLDNCWMNRPWSYFFGKVLFYTSLARGKFDNLVLLHVYRKHMSPIYVHENMMEQILSREIFLFTSPTLKNKITACEFI